jgi:hypothetical protein
VDMNRLADVTVARKVAEQLKVDAVLTGSVSEFANQHGLREEPAVGFNVQLIRTHDGAVLWRSSQSVLGAGFFNRDSIIESAQKAVIKTVDSLQVGVKKMAMLLKKVRGTLLSQPFRGSPVIPEIPNFSRQQEFAPVPSITKQMIAKQNYSQT